MEDNPRALDISVKREKSDIMDELMTYRNEKVQSDADFPASYKSHISGYGDAEEAFYESFANSTVGMTITPMTGFESMEDIGRAVNVIEDAEVGIRAKIEGIQEHAPVIQTGIDALESAGFDAYASVWETENYGGSLAEAIEGIESDGAKISVNATDELNDHHPDAYHIAARYNPQSNTLEPDTHVASSYGSSEIAKDIDARMEEALDEVGLLE